MVLKLSKRSSGQTNIEGSKWFNGNEDIPYK
jgi:hypothetical protein